jgi:hypothetical protein
MDDPLTWLPNLLLTKWDVAVESLRSEGVQVKATRPVIEGAAEPRSGGSIERETRVKLYENGDLLHTRVSHNDVDKDVTWSFTLDVKRKTAAQGAARREAHDTVQVLTRILELHRRNPHPDWNEVDAIKAQTVENFGDYQHRVITFRLKRHGQLLPRAIVQDLD